MSPVTIRIAGAEDHPRARAAYEAWDYHGGILPDDTVFLAERDGELIGIVRLTVEHGVRMLRGMWIKPEVRREGVGSQLLDALVAELRGKECACVPFSHLVGFYGQGGFVEQGEESAPAFLRERIARYRGKGLSVTFMRRPATANAS